MPSGWRGGQCMAQRGGRGLPSSRCLVGDPCPEEREGGSGHMCWWHSSLPTRGGGHGGRGERGEGEDGKKEEETHLLVE